MTKEWIATPEYRLAMTEGGMGLQIHDTMSGNLYAFLTNK
jgi:hypothetical protein